MPPAEENRPPPRKKRRRSWAFRLIVAAIVLLVLPVLAAGGTLFGIFYYYGKDPKLPNLNGIGDYKPEQIVRVLDRNGKLIGEIGTIHRTAVPYDRIPKMMIKALLAAEDAEYFEHEGVDYKGMVRAFVENVIRRKFAQGASTITQQVVKQLLLSPEKSMRRKVQEIILARRLSQRFSKEEVLSIYLNQMYFGHGRYGVEEAARYFFGKSIDDVDVGEAALLAGLLQAPERLSPYKHPDAAKQRQIYVLGQMVKLDYIYEDVAKKIAAAPIAVIPEGSALPNLAPEAVDTVRKEIEDRYGRDKLANLGFDVKTTIDAQLETLAREALERGLEEIDQRHNFRGPIARLSGRAIDKKRGDLTAERAQKPLTENDKVDGIVEKVEKIGKGPQDVRLTVFLGSGVGVVDLAAEPRYSQGKGPLAERFRPGDVVRVRLAPERARDDEGNPGLALELGPQAAMVVLDPARRDVLALVGGYGYRLGGFDRSQRAHRQPGSAFKPFIYAAAIDSKRYTAASVVNDTPEVFKLWKPQNHGNKFRGPVRLRVALADSINTIAIKLLSDIGILPVRELAVAAGLDLPPPEKLDLSLALGTATVTPIGLANAYATFASAGTYGEPRLISAFGNEPNPGIGAQAGRQAGNRLRRAVASAQRGRGGHRPQRGAQAQPPGGGQDRDHGRRSGRLVRRVHARAAGRRLGRLRRASDARPGRGGRARGPAHLDRVHDEGAGHHHHLRLRPTRRDRRGAHRPDHRASASAGPRRHRRGFHRRDRADRKRLRPRGREQPRRAPPGRPRLTVCGKPPQPCLMDQLEDS